uniref:Zinc finger protein 271 n=2 Tax=Culex pipiens TaxID=7175 RepID=A0A8D8MPH2_CULPI
MDGPFVTFCAEQAQPTSEAIPESSSVVVVTEEDDSGEPQVATTAGGPPKIVYLDRVCRTCLVEKEKDDLKDLFEFGLAETVMYCVGRVISVEESDGLPGHICMECLQEVERIISFRQQCERSDGTIRNLIEKSVVINQDSETKYEVLNVVLTDANGNTETSAVVVPIEELRFQLMNGGGGGRCSEEIVETESTTSENVELSFVAPSDILVTEEIIVQSQPEEDVPMGELIVEETPSEHEQQQQESTVLENLRQELSEFIGGTSAEIPKDQEDLDENDDDELPYDYLKDALTDEYIQSMEQQLAPSAPPRSENPAQDRLEQANLDSLINDEADQSGDGGEKDHGASKQHYCDDCNVGFENRRKFRVHMKKKHSEKKYECSYCSRRFAEQKQLRNHVLRHTGEKAHACEICNARFYERNLLNMHMRRHDGEKPYYCELCPKQFGSKSLLNTHVKCHRGEKCHICDVCEKGFTLSWQLTAHKRIHSNEKPYECPYCLKRFNQNGNLVIHKRIHTGERPFQCELCEKAYPSQGELRNHMRQHTGEKKVKNVTCTVCQKNYAGNGDLKIHMRTHTKERPYGCQECGKSFMLQVHLTVHMRAHTGEKPYACELCQKAFTTNYQLKHHMQVHTGEKNYGCDLCDRRFSSAANRNTHRKTHERTIS